MSRRLLAGIVGLGLIIFTFWFWGNDNDRATPADTEKVVVKDSEPTIPSDEVLAPQLQEPSTEKTVSAREPFNPPPKTPETEPPDDEADGIQEDEVAAPKITPPVAGGPLKILKRVYADESADLTAKDTERQIQETFGTKELPNDALHSVICHKSVCKIDIYWSEEVPLVHVALAMKVGPFLTGFIAMEPSPERERDGSLLIELYFLRAGFTLADFQ